MSPPHDPSTLTIGLPASIASLDPAKCRDSITLLVVSAIYETPFRPPAEFGPAEPLLFEGPLDTEVEGPDRWVYVGNLRDGLKFSDGTPVTPEIVVQSLQRATAEIRGAKISHEDRRISFELSRPNPRFDLTLSLAEASVVLEKDGGFLGTGPFVPAEVDEETIELVRNEHFRGKVAVERLRFRVFPEDPDGGHRELIRAVADGHVDLANCLSRGEVTPLTGLCKKFLPSNSTAILYLNTERPALADARVRRAILQSIDRRAVTGTCHTNILAFAAQSLLPPSMGLARDNIRRDLEGARALVAEVGEDAPSELGLLVVWARRPYIPEPRAVANVVASQIRELGIDVHLEPGNDAAGQPTTLSPADFFDRLEKGAYDMVLVGWIADTPDPADFLEANLSARSILEPGKEGVGCMNLARWRNAEADEALEAFRRDPGFGTESALLSLVADEAPLMPLMYGPSILVHSWRVKELRVRADGMPVWDAIQLGS